jgi:hypothetical protein
MLLQEFNSFRFGHDGLTADAFGEGWAGPEEGFRWTVGMSSALILHRPPADGDYVLLVAVTPFPGASPQSEKRLTISVNGQVLRNVAVATQRLIACRIPAGLIAQRPALHIAFEHPDAQQPSAVSSSPDDRLLAFLFSDLSLLRCIPPPVAAATLHRVDPATMPPVASLSNADLMLKFASLGDNCEFGIAQRFAGVEPLGLLRFSAASLTILIPALTEKFSLIDAPEHVEIRLRETLTPYREYVTWNRHYNIETHAHVFENEMPPHRMFIREMKKLGILGRLLMDDVRAGRRIFVYKQNDPVDMQALQTLAGLLQSFGPNTLLFVTQQPIDQAVGTVRRVGEGLLQARIDKFSSYDNAASQPSAVWIDICRAAYKLWQTGISTE